MNQLDKLARALATRPVAASLDNGTVVSVTGDWAQVNLGDKVVPARVPSHLAGQVTAGVVVETIGQENHRLVLAPLSAPLWIADGFVSKSGWTIVSARYRLAGDSLTFEVVVNPSSAVSIPSDGNISDPIVVGMPTGATPPREIRGQWSAERSHGWWSLTSDGNLKMRYAAPNSDLRASQQVTLTAYMIPLA